MSNLAIDMTDLYSEDDKKLIKRVFATATPRLIDMLLANKKYGFKKWKDFDIFKKRELAQEEERYIYSFS
jgi:hypothetical protein